jgi:pyrimidine-specific ribonucleoside hydrolase
MLGIQRSYPLRSTFSEDVLQSSVITYSIQRYLKLNTVCRCVVTILLVVQAIHAIAHESPRIPVIVDTDAALDDIRALVLLTQSDGVDLLAVVTSDGACSPDRGAENIRRVLHDLGRSHTQVAAGEALNGSSPPWRPMSEALGWSELGTLESDSLSKGTEVVTYGLPKPAAVELLMQTLKSRDDEIVYLCLGPLTTVSSVIERDSSLIEKIGVVYYSGSVPDAETPSWNTARDLEAAVKVFHSGLTIRAVQLADGDLLTFDADLLEDIRDLNTAAAELISQLHMDERVTRLIEDAHMKCWDEMAVMSLLEPDFFTFRSWNDMTNVRIAGGCDEDAARLLYLNLLSMGRSVTLNHRDPVVLNQYPTDPQMLREDIRPLVPAILERHGLAEWNAALITTELHRHLGIYSLLGVKMGIRAREILNAGLDELTVVSLAGSRPPLSCMTDGLQVSTGASLGRGKIAVDSLKAEPAAIFIKGKEHLTLRLKDDVIERIKAEFREVIEEHGNLTPQYWQAIRRSALRLWLDLDRRRIFDEIYTL